VHEQPPADPEVREEPARAATPVEEASNDAPTHAALLEPQPEHARSDTLTPEPPPTPPPSAAEIAELLEQAKAHLRELEITARPRDAARGRLPEGSGLRQAYADDRAIVLEGRLDQIRQWMALAKFGSREPGPCCVPTPLSRYDLVVVSEPFAKNGKPDDKALAYLHVVVPARGLAATGQRGRHEAWVAGERWINLADVLEPEREYLPFKTNGHESLHRQWAKAEVVEAIVAIAHEYRERTGLPLGVGDLSHVTGGKIEDHWTHQKGVDVDLYLLDPDDPAGDGRPRVWWHHFKRGVSLWTSKAQGKGEREPALDPNDELSHTPTSRRLEILAQIVFVIDEVAYFVHNDPVVLGPFDQQVGERRPGRRFLHAKNRGYWPAHADHVHLRWATGKLPVGDTPRP
jgi:hypothetical protein